MHVTSTYIYEIYLFFMRVCASVEMKNKLWDDEEQVEECIE